jgi:queuine tRNA-ribosyltransferase
MPNQKILKTQHGDITLPAFMPDATYGSIKSVNFEEVAEAGVEEIVTTTLHLETSLGSDYVEKMGGIHKFFNWNRPILTDSGGFQVFSLIHASDIKENKITDHGCKFKDPKTGTFFELTPESSQEIQHKLGSDIRIVLDEPTYGNASKDILEHSVRRTTDWAKRSKDKFLELNNISKEQFNDIDNNPRPLLMAVVQGGGSLDLRKRSFEELHKIGFDGYNWGGWPSDAEGNLDEKVGTLLPKLIPNDKIAYAMGVGTPDDIKACYEWGWDLFDCVLPTRNARHGFLYVEKGKGDKDFKNYSVLHIKREEYKNSTDPINPESKFSILRNTTRAYLRHLIKINEIAGMRIATLNNLEFYSNFMKNLQKASK